MTSEPGSDADELMTAGRFARATMLSAKALRLYADRNLLPPRLVDPANGYRYYGDDQVRTGWLIALLRSAELSLDEIAGIVAASAGTDRLRSNGRPTPSVASRGQSDRTRPSPAPPERGIQHDRTNHSGSKSDRPVLSVLRRMRPDEMDAVITNQVDRLRTHRGHGRFDGDRSSVRHLSRADHR